MREIDPESLEWLHKAAELLRDYIRKAGTGADGDVTEAEVYLTDALGRIDPDA